MSHFSNKLEAALAYAKLGWHVFPCHYMREGRCSCGDGECKSPGKHPRVASGFKAATLDEGVIRDWWAETPDANIGVRTGTESGFWALDLDGQEGLADWERLTSQHGQCLTVCQQTGGGGRQLFFLLPADREIRNRAKIDGLSIDVRGDGGYVVTPPSNHKSGNTYQWLSNPWVTAMVEAPAWVLDLVTKRHGKAVRRREPEDNEVWHARVTSGLDLETAPGVPEGQRHSRALELIGAHLGQGDNPFYVLQLALRWADRCDPPHDWDDITRIVVDLHCKDLEKVEEHQEIGWPVLGEEGRYGLAGEIVKAIKPQTEADPVAILAQLLGFFGSAIGRHAFFQVESTKHFANLFMVLVGQTAKARKGTSEGRVRECFRSIDEGWERYRIQQGLSSGEGLIAAVRDRVDADPSSKGEKGHPGVTDKRLLVIEPEFSSVLRIIKREGNILSPLIRQAWDSGNMQTMTKNSPLRATGAHVSLIGHITKEELLQTILEVDAFNGLANRFLWLCVQRSQLLPEGGKAVDLSPFLPRLEKAWSFAFNAGQLARDEAATQLWAGIYKELSKSKPGLLGFVTNRAEAQVLRLSMIYALLDRTVTIRVEHLVAAKALWQYCEDSARFIFGDSTGDRLADRIMASLQSGPLTTREIHDKTNRHFKGAEIAKALATLKRLGLVRVEKLTTGGRPAEKWYAVGNES